ncbi:hypothetical protein CHH28_10300 [Bacterioplanes sanyensis]|uniref:Uncharacterized protein n=1 Tax=Bacterioplanes sanyensis TaxID=1249553 RepID=A0A222FKK1_9GAMM|nr:hypothetical protein [Bacterioplanes sanyensis]ASP39044.1 hypothetical protein CHH28_10300 [Bacterioplanes sanyensis]
MKLLDFLDDPALNLLRRQMGADYLGDFQLFDPQKQLTYAEREALELGQLHTSASHTRALKDKTLALKNSRVWLQADDRIHLAHCDEVQHLRNQGQNIHCGTHSWSRQAELCLDCLALLNYQGLDARRARRPEFYQPIVEEFSLAEFQRYYPFYPLI